MSKHVPVKTLVLTITLAASAIVTSFAQGKKSVVIGTMIDRPNAVLVINPPNKDQGFLLPQLTTSERNSISPTSPQDDGLIVFDSTDKSFYYWNSGTWVKGLGDTPAGTGLLSYDPATQALSLNGGGTVSLTTLKEVPSMAGQAGKYLTTDGTTLTWATVGALGDITSIVAGQALTGGATSGDVNLSVNTDGTTISVNGSNQLQLSNNAVTTSKLAAGSVNSSHIIDGTVSSADILDGAVTTTDINSGGINKVMTTDGTGVVSWTDRSIFMDDNQNLILAGNTLNIDNATGVNLNNVNTAGDVAGPLNAQVIQAGVVNSAKIADGSIATTDINSGGVNKVLTTDGTGVVSWSDQSLLTAVAVPITQYYAVDPANFQPLEPSNGTNTLGLFTSGGGSYVFAKGNSREIMAALNLPDGATIQAITVFYEYTTLLGLLPFSLDFDRKLYQGGNNVLSTVAPILSIGTASIAMPGVAGLVIDNSTYTYRIHVTFNNILDTNDANGLARIYGIRIQYLK